MGNIVAELQKEIIENKDVVSLLRKAKMISAEFAIDDFAKWVDSELNGYKDFNDIPEYRNVIGEVKAKNPVYGMIPVIMPSSIADKLNSRKLSQPISELIDLSKNNKNIYISMPSELSEILCKNTGVQYPCYLIITSSSVLGIVESVKNRLLEWCLKLNKGATVDPTTVPSEKGEEKKTKAIPQQIYCYGPVINGSVSDSQIFSGNNSSNTMIVNDLPKMMAEIKQSIANEPINENNKRDALDILEDINDSIKKGKKKSIIKSALNGLKDFLISVGASITAAIITTQITGI